MLIEDSKIENLEGMKQVDQNVPFTRKTSERIPIDPLGPNWNVT
jgi:hypothetical protein